MSGLKVFWPDDCAPSRSSSATTGGQAKNRLVNLSICQSTDAESAPAESGPDDAASEDSPAATDDPMPLVYSFARWVERLRGVPLSDPVERARCLAGNCTCPECHRATVLPLQLNDGRIDNSGQVVPGSATLVGFRCEQCAHEWPA